MKVKELIAETSLELSEMKKLGMRVPAKALKMAKDEKIMKQYEDTDLSISELADLLIALSY